MKNRRNWRKIVEKIPIDQEEVVLFAVGYKKNTGEISIHTKLEESRIHQMILDMAIRIFKDKAIELEKDGSNNK